MIVTPKINPLLLINPIWQGQLRQLCQTSWQWQIGKNQFYSALWCFWLLTWKRKLLKSQIPAVFNHSINGFSLLFVLNMSCRELGFLWPPQHAFMFCFSTLFNFFSPCSILLCSLILFSSELSSSYFLLIPFLTASIFPCSSLPLPLPILLSTAPIS